MIDQTARAALAAQLVKGDLPIAAQIYEKNTKRKIHRSMLEKFIKGLHPFRAQGENPHDPAAMFAAIAEAVRQRKAREKKATIEANELIQTIIRDTTPPQPIAL